MKINVPEVEIELYKDGFSNDDLLNRADTGKQLSELVERIEDSLVIALDGNWGCGKSHFLQRWVGAHNHQNDGSATTIYFDAFQNDYLEDPLIALVGIIDDRLNSDSKATKAWKTIKHTALHLSKFHCSGLAPPSSRRERFSTAFDE